LAISFSFPAIPCSIARSSSLLQHPDGHEQMILRFGDVGLVAIPVPLFARTDENYF